MTKGKYKSRFVAAKVGWVLFLLAMGGGYANGGDLISAEWLSTNGATGDYRIDKWKVTVSFGPDDVTYENNAKWCLMGAYEGNSCYAVVRGRTCLGGRIAGGETVLTTPTTIKGMSPREYLRSAGVYTGTIETCSNPTSRYYGAIYVFMQNFSSTIPYIGFTLVDSHSGEGGFIPPIKPEPTPVSCKIDAVKGAFDFGKRDVQELVGIEDAIWVNVRCSGGGGNTASGKLTLKSTSGKNTVEMKNSDGDVIPVQLIASKETGSNILRFTAKEGYFVGHQIWSKILPFSISTYGTYSGIAVVDVTVD
ncbi:TPA: hypothetical protein ACKQDN_004189 [Serratia marcescens]